MAQLPVGYVAKTGEDIFPTTAPHLDVRVKKAGVDIDPGTIRSLLTRLKVGKDKKALWSQQGGQWKESFPITSPYGQREAPVPGASTYHLGQDYGIAGGTPIFWEGPGSYTPGKGYGTIKTTDEKGTPYEIRLLHTKPDKAGEITGQVEPQVAVQQAPQRERDTYIIIPTSQQSPTLSAEDYLSNYIATARKSQQSSKPQEGLNMLPYLMQAAMQTPDYLS